ncbi:MAG: alanine--glyoxylate aminotransferase family protein [Bacteroidetes bacterium]|nr:MAG: alanine--glyoxylate aminotransferase family protein [Bacteroidota bacterium]
MLLTPGPVPIPDFVIEAIARPVIPHRSSEFQAFFGKLLGDLKYYYQTEQSVALMHGSGTFGMDAAMYSLFRPGEQVLVAGMGKFSRRWFDYAQVLGLDAIYMEKPAGEIASPADVLEMVSQHPDLQGIVLTHCETSTGVILDLEEIAFSLRRARPDLLILCDAITTAGTLPFYFDAWGLDGAVSAQKTLMNPSGLTSFAFSERARARLRETHSSDFRNLYNYFRAADKNAYPYTAPVNLLYGFQAGLDYLRRETLPVVWNRSHHSAKTFREGVQAIGGALFAKSPSDSVTSFYFPGKAQDEIKRKLKEEAGILISGGQDELSGKILRVSHMGLADADRMTELLSALRLL